MDDVTRLKCPVSRSSESLNTYIMRACEGKKVLCVGAAGGVIDYLPHNKEAWLFLQLGDVADTIHGADIDTDGIAHAKAHGVDHIMEANCETMELEDRYDVIVFSDVIEHVLTPALSIENLSKHLAPGGQLLLTTPNPTNFNNVVRALLRKAPNEYYDHVANFFPEHIQVMCERTGAALREVIFFTHTDRRSLGMRIKSAIMSGFSVWSNRLSSSYVAVIGRD